MTYIDRMGFFMYPYTEPIVMAEVTACDHKRTAINTEIPVKRTCAIIDVRPVAESNP